MNNWEEIKFAIFFARTLSFWNLMRIQFVLSEKGHINSFIYCLKTLHGNFVEVLFNFNRSGLSLSQFWEDKNTDRGKYFFFLNSSCFSRISGSNDNLFFKMNVKDIVNRLRLHKKEVPLLFSQNISLKHFWIDTRNFHHHHKSKERWRNWS